MRSRTLWWLSVAMAAALLPAGCDSSSKDAHVNVEPQHEAGQGAPVVSGPYREFPVDGKREDILKTIRADLKGTGIVLARTGGALEATWLLGRSQAGRDVLVEMFPVYPGRFILRITVAGRDLLTRQLLDRLANNLARDIQ